MKKIPYISTTALTNLRDSIELNLENYSTGDFAEHAKNARWQSTLDLEYDDTLLANLHHDPKKPTFENDRSNSEIIGIVFKKLTPQLACREEIWARLSHIECLDYSRARWLTGLTGEKLRASADLHMFASGMTKRRNNHAISRLWWTYHLAKLVRPSDPKSALTAITQSVDLRKTFFDHPFMVARGDITRAFVDIIESVPDIAKEKNWRKFIKTVNKAGGGRVFEVMPTPQIRLTLDRCVDSVLV